MTFPALQTTQHQRPLAKRSHHAMSSGSIVSAPLSRASRGIGASGMLCGTPSESDLPPPFWWNQVFCGTVSYSLFNFMFDFSVFIFCYVAYICWTIMTRSFSFIAELVDRNFIGRGA